MRLIFDRDAPIGSQLMAYAEDGRLVLASVPQPMLPGVAPVPPVDLFPSFVARPWQDRTLEWHETDMSVKLPERYYFT